MPAPCDPEELDQEHSISSFDRSQRRCTCAEKHELPKMGCLQSHGRRSHIFQSMPTKNLEQLKSHERWLSKIEETAKTSSGKSVLFKNSSIQRKNGAKQIAQQRRVQHCRQPLGNGSAKTGARSGSSLRRTCSGSQKFIQLARIIKLKGYTTGNFLADPD